MTLPDVQNTQDDRGIEIDTVGVSSIKFPIPIVAKDGGLIHTVADIAMAVRLPHYEKGTHMSRFMLALHRQSQLSLESIPQLLELIRTELDAKESYIRLAFPVFFLKKAPESEHFGMMDYQATIEARLGYGDSYECLVGVGVHATTLCPCSKEISERGAHNQRSLIKIKVRPNLRTIVWFEDLIRIAELSASCDLYSVLKRPDEKYVTETAYDRPRFVEDVVRECALKINAELVRKEKIQWYEVSSVNEESIHNHNAYARIEHGTRNNLFGVFNPIA